MYEEFKNTRKQLAKELHKSLEDNEKQFLLSFKKGNPQWNLLSKPKLKDLPGYRNKKGELSLSFLFRIKL